MPFITEELYQLYFKNTQKSKISGAPEGNLPYERNEKAKSIHISEWPEAGKMDEKIHMTARQLIYDKTCEIQSKFLPKLDPIPYY